MGYALSWSWQGYRWVGCIRKDGVEADTGCLVFFLCRDLQAVPCKVCIPEMWEGSQLGKGSQSLGHWSSLKESGEPGACSYQSPDKTYFPCCCQTSGVCRCVGLPPRHNSICWALEEVWSVTQRAFMRHSFDGEKPCL